MSDFNPEWYDNNVKPDKSITKKNAAKKSTNNVAAVPMVIQPKQQEEESDDDWFDKDIDDFVVDVKNSKPDGDANGEDADMRDNFLGAPATQFFDAGKFVNEKSRSVLFTILFFQIMAEIIINPLVPQTIQTSKQQIVLAKIPIKNTFSPSRTRN